MAKNACSDSQGIFLQAIELAPRMPMRLATSGPIGKYSL
jgi:hypothetical protein